MYLIFKYSYFAIENIVNMSNLINVTSVIVIFSWSNSSSTMKKIAPLNASENVLFKLVFKRNVIILKDFACGHHIKWQKTFSFYG